MLCQASLWYQRSSPPCCDMNHNIPRSKFENLCFSFFSFGSLSHPWLPFRFLTFCSAFGFSNNWLHVFLRRSTCPHVRSLRKLVPTLGWLPDLLRFGSWDRFLVLLVHLGPLCCSAFHLFRFFLFLFERALPFLCRPLLAPFLWFLLLFQSRPLLFSLHQDLFDIFFQLFQPI